MRNLTFRGVKHPTLGAGDILLKADQAIAQAKSEHLLMNDGQMQAFSKIWTS
jgi:hypothetical protein